jgi:DNA-binding GntR family transcriptional regulator
VATLPSLSAPHRRTAADEAELALFQAIMDRAIPPGSPLRLQELADQLDMSMMPVREALRRLQNHGLVEIVAHKGAWVRPLTRKDLFDTYFTRMHLEGLAFMTAAERFSEEHAEAARAALGAQREAERRHDLIASRNAHDEFHFILYGASGSDWLLHAIRPVWRNSERYRVESMRNAAHVRKRAREHTQMLEALSAHDGPAAVELLISHLQTSVDLVAKSLEGDGDPASMLTLPTAADISAKKGSA